MPKNYITRKIGTSFEKDGKTFKVVEQAKRSRHLCENCAFFKENCTKDSFMEIRGLCFSLTRTDRKLIIFVKQEK